MLVTQNLLLLLQRENPTQSMLAQVRTALVPCVLEERPQMKNKIAAALKWKCSSLQRGCYLCKQFV